MSYVSMKSIFNIVICVGLFWQFNCCCVQAASVNKIVAIVGNSIITQSELTKRVSALQRGLHAATTSESALRAQALNDLIDISLQVQFAKRGNIDISDNELDIIIANIARDMKLTLSELKEKLLQHEGITFTEFRKQLRNQSLIARAQHMALGRSINVSDSEIKEILRTPPATSGKVTTQYHVLDILLKLADATAAEESKLLATAKRMVVKLRKQKGNIDDVIREAQEKSAGLTITKEELGWRKADELPELFVKKVVAMRVNQVSEPIQAPNGVHILKLLDVNAPQLSKSAKMTKEQAAEIVFHRKLNKKVGPWLKELRKHAYIKIIK